MSVRQTEQETQREMYFKSKKRTLLILKNDAESEKNTSEW